MTSAADAKRGRARLLVDHRAGCVRTARPEAAGVEHVDDQRGPDAKRGRYRLLVDHRAGSRRIARERTRTAAGSAHRPESAAHSGPSSDFLGRLESACAFGAEVLAPVGTAAGRADAVAKFGPADSFGTEGRTATRGRFAATTRGRLESASNFAAAVTPDGTAGRCAGPTAFVLGASFGTEVSHAPPAGAAFRCAGAPSDRLASFGAEVSSVAPARARLPVRRPRGGRAGSWRSTASRTTRPSSCPNVMCGST